MKKLFLITLLSTFFSSLAFGQFVAGPQVGPALTIPSGGYKMDARWNTTNIGTPVVFTLQGDEPVSLWTIFGTTNASVTNVVFTFQLSQDNSTWFNNPYAVGGAPYQVTLPGNGTGSAVYVTNIVSGANASGIKFIRLYSVSNLWKAAGGGSSNSWWFTNCSFVQAK